MEPRQRLIFALDVPDAQQALCLVELLADYVGCFKIGLELFVAAGPSLVAEVVKKAPVFLDLKLHDIPATVGRAAQVARDLGVTFLTAHVDDGGRSIKAAVDSALKVGILGVTVLTSISESDIKNMGMTISLKELVMRRAMMAKSTGCRGIICSGQEAAFMRETLGSDMLIITPGIRPAYEAVGDQQRVVTPAQAISSGADYIVVGRPIRDAANPTEAAERIVAEIASVSSSKK